MRIFTQLAFTLGLLWIHTPTPAIAGTDKNFAEESFSGKYKIVCRGAREGCPCYENPTSASGVKDLLFHLEPFTGTGEDDTTSKDPKPAFTALLGRNGESCYYPTDKLRPIYWANTKCPDESTFEDLPFPSISSVLEYGSERGTKSQAYKVFPTFYYVADETFYGPVKTEKLYEARTGNLLATVNADFREDLDIQGTGKLNDGRVLNVWKYTGGIWDYVVLPEGSYGLGIRDHYLYPFRTAAVDFRYVCKKGQYSNCGASTSELKRRFVGSLLYVKQLVGAKLPNGAVHDGYVCAHDVGGAIKEDRIDLFVGNMGGGNPYLPECRRTNSFIKHGIESLVPYDWRLFDEDGRVEKYEYRRVSPHKALDVQVVRGAKCKNLWDL